jgi:hypothetical protein
MSLLYKPDFIVAGPAKTGTTWLYRQLYFVTGFKLPPAKEISFFVDAYLDFIFRPGNKHLWDDYKQLSPDVLANFVKQSNEGIKARRKNNITQAFKARQYLWALYYLTIPRTTSSLSFKLYSRLFTQSDGIASGDISPLYFTLRPEIIALIAKRFPKLKVVFILRNPVEREWSNIRMNYFSEVPSKPFSIEAYLQKQNLGSDYKRHLENWETYFDKNRISYLFYDDLKNDPLKFINSFIQIIKPDATITKLISEPVGQGIDKQFDPEIKTALLKKNLPQYEFLAEKFGPNSYPATWKKNALAFLDKNL